VRQVYRPLEKSLTLRDQVVGKTEWRAIEAVEPYCCVVDLNTAVGGLVVGDDRLGGGLGRRRLPSRRWRWRTNTSNPTDGNRKLRRRRRRLPKRIRRRINASEPTTNGNRELERR